MAAEEIKYLLELPSDFLVVLASGFVAYRIAYTGKDSSHKSVEVIFFTAVFATVARLVISGVALIHTGELAAWLSYGLAFTASLTCAAFWRRKGEAWVFETLRRWQISTSDRHSSALHSMIAREGLKPNQLVVRKTDGTRVMCNNLSAFNGAPFAPYLLGPDGSVSMYVTDHLPANSGDWVANPSVRNDWGCAITYIPPSQIAEIEFRYPVSGSASEAAAQAAAHSGSVGE